MYHAYVRRVTLTISAEIFMSFLVKDTILRHIYLRGVFDRFDIYDKQT